MTPLTLGILIAVAAIVVCLILFVGVPYLVRKNVPVDTYLNVADQGLGILKQFIDVIAPNQDKKNLDTIVNYADLAVKYAEQLYISGQLPADQRKQAALDFITNAAKNAGITLTQGDLTFAGAVIESMVYLLPATHTQVVTPVVSGTATVHANF